MLQFIFNIFKKKDELDKYSYSNIEHLTYTCSALSGAGRDKDAIRLYNRFEHLTINDPLEEGALTTIVKCCSRANDRKKLIKFGSRLKMLDPHHPYIEDIKKKFKIIL